MSTIYILEDRYIYRDVEIIMISKDYNKVKECLKELPKKILHIYTIKQYQIDKKFTDKKTIVEIMGCLDGSFSTSIDENYKY